MAAHLNNEKSGESASDESEELIRCEYCNLYFRAGEEYDSHIATHLDGSFEEANQFRCPYCGEWFQAGAEYRGHVFTMHPEEYDGSGDEEDGYEE